jgi:hypothetical protein
MRMSVIRKRHPEFWTVVEAAVWDDMLTFENMIPANVRRRIAYNAAAIATSDLDKKAADKVK